MFELLCTSLQKLKGVPIIAEDLGVITPDVHELREAIGGLSPTPPGSRMTWPHSLLLLMMNVGRPVNGVTSSTPDSVFFL